MDFFAPSTLMLWRMTMSPMSRMEKKIQWINLSQLVRMRSRIADDDVVEDNVGSDQLKLLARLDNNFPSLNCRARSQEK